MEVVYHFCYIMTGFSEDLAGHAATYAVNSHKQDRLVPDLMHRSSRREA